MKKFTVSIPRLIGIIVSWSLVGACMAIIFSLSAQVAEQSVETSMGLLGFIIDHFGKIIGHDALRSIAHALEYCGLAALVFHASIWTQGYALPRLSFAFAVVYSLTDEIHQIFVPGRAFQLTDLLVDAIGALAGVIVCTLIYIAVVSLLKKNKKIR